MNRLILFWLHTHFPKRNTPLCGGLGYLTPLPFEQGISPRILYSVMDKGWSHYFINLLGAVEFGHIFALPALGWRMQRSAIISLRKWMRERQMGGGEQRRKKSNLIVWRLHMVPWLFGSPWLAASRLRPFTVSNLWQTSLSSLHPPFNIQPPYPHPESG